MKHTARHVIKYTAVGLVTALAALLSAGFAQEPNPAAQVVVSFANILDPQLVAEVEGTGLSQDDPAAFATALLERLETLGIIAPTLRSDVQAAITAGVLPRSTLVLFLADLLNGVFPLDLSDPNVLFTAEAALSALGLRIPLGNEAGELDSLSIASIITSVVVEGIVSELGDVYDLAISPLRPVGP